MRVRVRVYVCVCHSMQSGDYQRKCLLKLPQKKSMNVKGKMGKGCAVESRKFSVVLREMTVLQRPEVKQAGLCWVKQNISRSPSTSIPM